MRMAELQFRKEFASRLFPLEFRSKMALALFERLFAERRQSRQLSSSRPAGQCRISFPLMLILLDELRWIATALFLRSALSDTVLLPAPEMETPKSPPSI